MLVASKSSQNATIPLIAAPRHESSHSCEEAHKELHGVGMVSTVSQAVDVLVTPDMAPRQGTIGTYLDTPASSK